MNYEEINLPPTAQSPSPVLVLMVECWLVFDNFGINVFTENIFTLKKLLKHFMLLMIAAGHSNMESR